MYYYTLRIGDNGQEVKRLQHNLGISVDGDFGPKTHAAVEQYQKMQRLVVDGIVGPATFGSLSTPVHLGIDVSHWNGNIRWGDVNPGHIQFVWAKISQGVNYTDPNAQRNLIGCRDNGIRVGGYHFPSPQLGGSNDPKLEVQDFLKYYGGCIPSGDMLPVLDLKLKYIKPLYYDDEVSLTTKISEMPGTRIYFEYDLKNPKGVVTTIAETTLVFIDHLSGKPCLIPENFKSKIKPYFP